MRHRWTVLTLSLLFASPALGLTPRLVKDINPLPFAESSDPDLMVGSGNLSYFVADDGESGKELWRTDGTEAGTFQVVDACLGDCSGNPVPVALAGDLYFFAAFVENSGFSLWVTKGTPATTFRLTDGIQVQAFSRRALWVAGALYFAAADGVHGSELWRSNGTVAGTFLVADLRPGSQSSNPDELTDLGGRLFFRADNGASGPALWKSDGTAAGTQLVRDPMPASTAHTGPALMRAIGKNLFFTAPAPRGGVTQLWKSDGTNRGTVTLTSLKPGPVASASVIPDVTVLGNRLLFVTDTAVGQELWVSDGTPKGTRAVTAFANPRAFSLGGGRLALPQTALGHRIMFRADDGEHGVELWTSDGTPKGTRLIKDICPGPCAGPGLPGVAAGGRWYFTAGDGTRGVEVWVTDGTAAGTRILRDICRGACASSPFGFFAVGERIFFLAQPDPNALNIYQLWRSDGTLRGTVRLTSFVPDGDLPFLEPFARNLAGGALVFAAADSLHGRELWRSDGTVQGTRLFADLNRGDLGGSFPQSFMTAGGRLYFLAYTQAQPSGLWTSDGTEAGTRLVDGLEEAGLLVSTVYSSAEAGGKLIFSTSRSNAPSLLVWASDGTSGGTLPLLPEEVQPRSNLRTAGSSVFFVGGDPIHGEELWVTDGTPEGTRLVVDLVPGENRPDIAGMTAFKGRLYFWARGEDQGTTLWTSDGTAAGTFAVVEPGRFYQDSDILVEHAGRLWFFATEYGTNRAGLWSTDGTAAGTAMAVELSEEVRPTHFMSAGSLLFFAAGAFGGERGLWASDGTPAGTRRLSSSLFQPNHQEMAGVNGTLYFRSLETSTLWKSDGTEVGTAEVRDQDGQPIRLAGAYNPSGFRIFAGRLYFVNEVGSLVESDGTPAGTSVILEKAGPELLPVGDHLYFRHRERETGYELWVLE